MHYNVRYLKKSILKPFEVEGIRMKFILQNYPDEPIFLKFWKIQALSEKPFKITFKLRMHWINYNKNKETYKIERTHYFKKQDESIIGNINPTPPDGCKIFAQLELTSIKF